MPGKAFPIDPGTHAAGLSPPSAAEGVFDHTIDGLRELHLLQAAPWLLSDPTGTHHCSLCDALGELETFRRFR